MNEDSKKGIIATLTNFGIPYVSAMLTPFLAVHQEWMYAWYSAIGLYGVYMEYNQDKVNSFIKFIEENPSVFLNEIVEAEDFREGFLITFEKFLKIRGEKKRETVKRIFLGFTASNDKEKFELERMYDCLEKISMQHMVLFKLIQKHKGYYRVMYNDGDGFGSTYDPRYDEMRYLVSLGLLQSISEAEIEEDSELTYEGTLKEKTALKQEESVAFSEFGKKFIEFVNNN